MALSWPADLQILARLMQYPRFQVDHRRTFAVVPHAVHQLAERGPGTGTGREQCSNPVEWVGVLLVRLGYSSGLVIAGSGDVGGVVVPVGSGLAGPPDGGARGEVQRVGEDRGG